jgi:hypothetical protein
MLVILNKVEETESYAVYAYGADERSMGELALDKATGDILETVPAPVANHRKLFMGGLTKIKQAYQSGKPLPQRELFASG